MKHLTFELSRHIDPTRASHPYAILNQRTAQLKEARSVVDHPRLALWKPEASALVEALAAQVDRDRQRVALFEAKCEPLAKAIADEAEARQQWENAKAEKAIGSTNRDLALNLRDSVDAADSALLVRVRELKACAMEANGVLPGNSAVDEGTDAREIVERLAQLCVARVVHSQKVAPSWTKTASFPEIPREKWDVWMETSEDEMTWIPFHAARKIAHLKTDFEQVRDSFFDPRRVDFVLYSKDLIEQLATFKSKRIAHIEMKVRKAHAELEKATAAAAALGAAQ